MARSGRIPIPARPTLAFRPHGAFWSQPLRNGAGALQNWFINTTSPGAYAFSTVTSTDVTNFAIGEWISLASLDVEYFGYPPTPQQFEFVRVSAINQYTSASVSSATYNSGAGQLTLTFASAPFGAIGNLYNGVALAISGLTGSGVSPLNGTWPIASTASSGTVITLSVTPGLGSLTVGGGTLAAMGIVTIEQAIRYQHRSDFPDGNNSVKVGKARVWQLNTGGWTINGVANQRISWDVDHKFIDMNTGCPPNVTSGTLSAQSYWTMSGRKIETENWVGPVSPNR